MCLLYILYLKLLFDITVATFFNFIALPIQDDMLQFLHPSKWANERLQTLKKIWQKLKLEIDENHTCALPPIGISGIQCLTAGDPIPIICCGVAKLFRGGMC